MGAQRDTSPEPAESVELPLAIGSAQQALAWRERLRRAKARVDLLDRQAALWEFFDWAEARPDLAGLASVGVEERWGDYDDQNGELCLLLAFEDGSRMEQRPRRALGPARQAFLRPPQGKSRPSAKAAEAVWAAWDKLVECFGFEFFEELAKDPQAPLPMAIEAWRGRLFTPEERAAWEAGLIGAEAPAAAARSSKALRV